MKSKFASYTVYATVVLTMSSLAILSLTVSNIMVESASSDHEDVVAIPRHPQRQCAHDEALAAGLKGMQFVFDTVKNQLTKHEHCSSDVESGRAGSFAGWTTLYDVIFSQIPKDHPLACSKVRQGAYLMMDKAVDAIYTGITVATSNTSSDISSSELQTLQDTAIFGLKTAAIRIYAYLRSQKNDLETNPAIYRYEEDTICAATLAIRKMFGAIRILMAAASSKTGTGSKDHLFLVTVIAENANINAVNWVRCVFDTLDILFPVYNEKQV